MAVPGTWASWRATLPLLLSWPPGVRAYWLAERFYFLPQRMPVRPNWRPKTSNVRAELAKMGIAQVDGDMAEAKARILAQPWWLDWTAGLFPVIVSVFLLRSFVVEPFKIPSGSMIPTLLVAT